MIALRDAKLLDAYALLVPLPRSCDLRVLELGTDAHGSSALALASRYGSVVSISDDINVTLAARREAPSPTVAYHCGPLLAGWPDEAPYHLVLHWSPIDRIPSTLLDQVGVVLVAPLVIGSHHPAMPTVVLRRVPNELTATVAHAEDHIPPDVWRLQYGAVLRYADDSYSVVCECDVCMRIRISGVPASSDER